MIETRAQPFSAVPVLWKFGPVRAEFADHPLAQVRDIASRTLSRAYAAGQFDEIGDEGDVLQVVCAALLQMLYSYSNDEHLIEQLEYNRLYRWFVGFQRADAVWSSTAYTLSLKALRDNEAGTECLASIVKEAYAFACLLPGRFRIDAALLKAWTVSGSGGSALRGGEAMSNPGRPGRLERARAVILRRVGDPALDADAIASELCMSRRALYLLFERHGLTPTRAIREIRLDCCLTVLRDERQRHRKITDIAMEHGFHHFASFSRQFKARYGVTPRAARLLPAAASSSERLATH